MKLFLVAFLLVTLMYFIDFILVEPIRIKWRKDCNFDCLKCKCWDCQKKRCDYYKRRYLK